jgi:hypothetical protein
MENGYYLGWRGMEFLIPACMMGHPKIPGIVKKNYLKYSYNLETFVPFKVLRLGLDAAIPGPFPLLETLSKIFNNNAVKGRQ